MIADEFAEYHYHHNARGEVVENGRQNERHKGDAPQQRTLRPGLHNILHPVETTVLVDNLHDSHGSHQEEERRGRVAQMVGNHLVNKLGQSVARSREVMVHQLDKRCRI